MPGISSPSGTAADDLQRFLRHAGPIAWDPAAMASCVIDPDVARLLHVAAIVEEDTGITARQARSFGIATAPDLAAFLTVWEEEEAEHCRALRALLAHQRYDAPQRPPSSISLRRRAMTHLPAGALRFLPQTGFLLCALGAAAEYSALVTYTELAKQVDEPAVSQLLRDVIRQEGRHLAYFLAAAQRRGEAMSTWNGHLARRAIVAVWEPVGLPSLGAEAWRAVFSRWLEDDEVLARFAMMDRVVDSIPHLSGLDLMDGFQRQVTGRTRASARW